METKEKLYLPIDPYRGIDPFRYADRDIFSERDEEQLRLFNLINVYRGCLLYGKSGTGKSSLIAAGLIPLLEEFYQSEIIRVYPSDTGTFIISKILIADDTEADTPGKFEIKNYKSSIFDPANKHDNKITLSAVEFEDIVKQPQTADKIPVLIFDQFEELITLFEETNQTGQEEKITGSNRIALQEKIIVLLQRLYFNSSLKVKIVFAFREDYIAKFAKLFEAIPDVKNSFLRITALPKKRLESIVSYPFSQDPGRKVYSAPFSPALTKSLQNKLLSHFGEDDIVLTDVQIVCYFLYKCPVTEREGHLNQSDAISKILELFYRDILDRFNENEKPVAIAILSILVLNERTRNIFHHDLIIREYLEQTGKEDQTVAAPYIELCENVLLNLENKARIIRKEERKGGAYYEISSEAIIPYINQLKVTKEKEDFIKETAEEAEIERKKRRRELMYILGIALLIIIGVFYSFYLRSQNEIQRKQDEAKIAGQKLKADNDKQMFQEKIARQKLKAENDNQKLQLQNDRQQLILINTRQKLDEDRIIQQKLVQNNLEQNVASAKKYSELVAKQLSQQTQARRKVDSLYNVTHIKLDSVNARFAAIAFADSSLKVNRANSKKKFADSAYRNLPSSLTDSDTFVPQVYAALNAIHLSRFRSRKYDGSSNSRGYKKIDGVFNIGGNSYFNMPFNGITDTTRVALFKDTTILHSWINEQGNTLVSFAVTYRKQPMSYKKQLIVCTIKNNKSGPPTVTKRDTIPLPKLGARQDILSLVFDPNSDNCTYSTCFPGGVYRLSLASTGTPALIKPLRYNEYMFLANRADSIEGITNLGSYSLWANHATNKALFADSNAIKGSVVTAIAFGGLTHKVLFAGCENGCIYRINPFNKVLSFYYPTNSGARITCLSSSPDGKWLVAGCFDGSIKLWRHDKKRTVPAEFNLGPRSGGVSSALFTTQNNRITLTIATDKGYVYYFPLSIKTLHNLPPD